MELNDAILGRRSVRKFTDYVVTDAEIRQILDNLEDQGSLLMQGVLENMLPGRGPGADGSLLPYYMVLATQGPVEPFLEHHGIGGKVLRVLHTPKGQNAVPVGGRPFRSIWSRMTRVFPEKRGPAGPHRLFRLRCWLGRMRPVTTGMPRRVFFSMRDGERQA